VTACFVITVPAMAKTVDAYKISFEVNKFNYIISTPEKHALLDENELLIKIKSKKWHDSVFSGEIAFRTFQGFGDATEEIGADSDIHLPEVSLGTLDRFVLQCKLENQTIWVGKQNIPWGTQTMFSPSDVFNPSSVLNPYGKKMGINAIRTHYYISDLSYVSVLYALPSDYAMSADDIANPKHGKIALQYATNIARSDVFVGTIYDGYRSHIMPTVALKGDMPFDLGYRIEAITVFVKNKLNAQDFYKKVDLAVGIDGSITNDFMWFFETYFHNSGQNLKAQDALHLTSVANLENRQYGGVGVEYKWDEFSRFSSQCITPFLDNSFLLNFTYQTQALSNLDIVANTTHFLGRGELSAKSTGLYGIYQLWLRLRF